MQNKKQMKYFEPHYKKKPNNLNIYSIQDQHFEFWHQTKWKNNKIHKYYDFNFPYYNSDK